jgi:hypothetical protein
MAVMLAAKPDTATQFYSWSPTLVEGDAISSFTLTPTTLVVEDSQSNGDEIEFYLSGGVTGEVYPVAALVVTGFGETLTETLYCPVSGPGNSFTYTADDIIDFALRPVVGLSGSRTSVETADALEWLNDMIAEWDITGASAGIPLPLVAGDTLYCSDGYVRALKANLRVCVAEQYGQQVSPSTARAAMAGLQTIKFARIRDREPTKATFY